MKPKYLIPLLTLIAVVGLTQNSSEKSINKYVKEIDNLRARQKIDSLYYHNRSICGGTIQGFYSNSHLVLIESHLAVELYSSQLKVYHNKNIIFKIEYQQSIPNWDKYEIDFPNDTTEALDDISKMIEYTDTSYIIYLTEPIEMKTYSNSILISTVPNSKVIEKILECAKQMKFELEEKKYSPQD